MINVILNFRCQAKFLWKRIPQSVKTVWLLLLSYTETCQAFIWNFHSFENYFY